MSKRTYLSTVLSTPPTDGTVGVLTYTILGECSRWGVKDLKTNLFQ